MKRAEHSTRVLLHIRWEPIRFELGHLLLHGASLYEGDSKMQANDFASAFLMPRAGLLGSLRGNVTLDELSRLRGIWKVSAMAIAVRLHQLDVTSDWTYRLMCQEPRSAVSDAESLAHVCSQNRLACGFESSPTCASKESASLISPN